jgi:hypothetical protein
MLPSSSSLPNNSAACPYVVSIIAIKNWRRAARSDGRYPVAALIGEDGASPNIRELSRCHMQVGRMQ